uniref:BTB/POZ domain-containing protein 16 n=1 Tax=Geotrypetes seraphini TaxID=260995 RepID=A0A6P8QNL6_GEOSA|nr:BTB/POZ domain-containing protein 16 isoform X2 [Geotrypetes seraphini]
MLFLRASTNPMQRTERKQAGFTNRWQLSHSLDSDLLGSSQAFKAVRHSFSSSLLHIMTAGSMSSLSEDSASELGSLPSLMQEKSMSLPCIVPSEASSSLEQTMPKRRHSWYCDQVIEDIFSYHSKSLTEGMEPEISLECLGIIWELHRPYLIKSNTLAKLFMKAVQEDTSHDLETDRQDRGEPAQRKREKPWKLPVSPESIIHALGGRRSPTQNKHKKITLSLDIQDNMVTRTGFAIALRNLYCSECVVDMENVLGVLASADVLQIPSLFYHCLNMMKTGISSSTISSFYNIAERYNQERLKEECEHWLAVNLVPKLRSQAYLGQIPEDLLHKVLTSARLFTFSEYHLFKTVLYWIYLKENPTCHILPAHSIILTFFKSFPKASCFLESEVGQKYMPLFRCLRLYGITDARQLEEIENINILPLKWLFRILSCHYQALQAGGDSVLHTDFFTQMVRAGLIVEQNPDYHTQLFSRYGFFFQLKVLKQHSSDFSFFMQRLNPTVPNLPFCINPRSCFCLDEEREVSYEIQVLALEDGIWQEYKTGLLTQTFGLTNKTCKSKTQQMNPETNGIAHIYQQAEIEKLISRF